MILNVEAKPNARKNEFSIINDNTIKVRIKAPPVEGKANEAIIEYLSEIFQTSKSKITLLKGTTSKFKRFEIAIDDSAIYAITKPPLNK
jgi:uncharacterized protein (TIGR00251 family)